MREIKDALKNNLPMTIYQLFLLLLVIGLPLIFHFSSQASEGSLKNEGIFSKEFHNGNTSPDNGKIGLERGLNDEVELFIEMPRMVKVYDVKQELIYEVCGQMADTRENPKLKSILAKSHFLMESGNEWFYLYDEN
ncbi:hypothetical protein [Xanthovirga aplysinae]|uniref:hypothetical protein n=1 Tax=Xanthovirga aplysinae TaxID=2529853 RepID=UPI0012BCD7F5|nr:hypothetical protein [Xanthovirga aplysinae]MTI30551.1 hypothetical protein [Xanthovirga aplysinae]